MVALWTSSSANSSVSPRFYLNGHLTPVTRIVPNNQAPTEAAVRLLVAGPNEIESAAGFVTAIPAGVSINKLTFSQNTAEIDLSSEVTYNLDEARLSSIFDQFRSTLGDFPQITTIKLTSGGYNLSGYLPPTASVGRPAAPLYRTMGVGLSGKKICLGPSHGRFWNGGGWYWQRGIMCDLGEAALEDTNSIRLVQF